ncbi:MAG TPA: BTAD domain-containing putative transcriptional regulator [Gaiellaceae bacterium]|nr:BTAD domain-containing putative transcriptional regulator [Gaiellaceae bacterium]
MLGPLAVVEDGRVVPLDRQRLRALLAFLLLHANDVVSSDRLIDEIWGPEPPKTAAASLQNYVSRLRKAIGSELLVSQPPGYVLRVDPERFDLARFERLTAEARGTDPRERVEKLRAALALWRGPVLEDLAFEPFAQDEARRLEDARLAALEERIEAELELGLDGDLVGELEELVEGHPLRERFHAQLMRALYRAGRQADALEAFQSARRVLMDELGLEPGVELRGLQQAILQQDPALGAGGAAEVERGADRRTVTVLLCDLVDSTRLASDLDPEVYRQLISRYFELVREPISRHGGTIEKFIGDAVMAVFGVPQLHEDDALRAVRAAAEMQAALRGEEWAVPVGVRIGLSTGEVHVLSAAGEDLHVSGAVASAASQLEQNAPPGGILIGGETHRLVRDAVKAERIGDAWLLEEVIENSAAYARRFDAPLVGREQELERLLSAYANAVDEKQCRVVTVVGEAGIGKTRLARELVAAIRDQARVLVGRCVSYGEGATYLPIRDIVRQAADEHSLAGIRELLGAEQDADAVAQRVAELTGIAESPAAPGEAFWAVRRLLEAMAHERQIVVVLDDIHWAEPTLLDLVEYLGGWAQGPILMLCLARRELLEERPGWGGPASTGFLVQLDPLPDDQLGTLVGRLAAEPVDPQVQDHIVEHAGGNPLFAEQLLALAYEAPDLALERPPASVDALLASRLDRLHSRELEVLRRAAVVGRRFTALELGDLAPKEDATRALFALAERGLIHSVEPDLFRFHHVLVRDVAYRGMPKSQRAELHESAARGLDRREAADELVGYHFEQAFAYHTELARDDEHAAELALEGGQRLGRAGIRAWKRADAPAAVNLLTRAVALLPEADEFACELGAALRASNDIARAREVLVPATEAADERVALRARIELALVRSVVESDRADELLDIATASIPVLEAAQDDRALGRAWLCVAHVRGSFYCEYERMEESARLAASYYRRAGWSPSSALELVGTALYHGPKAVAEAIDQCEGLRREHDGDRASEANIIVWLGALEAMRKNFADARAHVSRARAIYEEFGLTMAVADTCGRLFAAIDMMADRPRDAEQTLLECCEVLQQRGLTAILATRAGELAQAIYWQGRYEEAELWTRLARESAGRDDLDAALSWQPVQAKILARQGNIDEAERLARETLALVGPTDSISRQADSLMALAEILDLADRRPDAELTIRHALELYEKKGNLASLERARALLPDAAIAE